MRKQIENAKQFGVPVVVAVNAFKWVRDCDFIIDMHKDDWNTLNLRDKWVMCSAFPFLCWPAQDRHWGRVRLGLPHGQSCWSLWCCAMLPLGWRWSRCCGPGSGCPESQWDPQQLQIPLWFGGLSFNPDCCSSLLQCFPFWLTTLTIPLSPL